MREFRQYVPMGASQDLDAATERVVRENLSSQVSNDDNPNEFYDEVVISRRDSKDGGHWVHGSIERDATPFYGDGQEVPFAQAQSREPVDMLPIEYEAHIAAKKQRDFVPGILRGE